MKIVVDAMGSDRYPDPEIEGALQAVKEFNIEIVLVGDEALLTPKLEKANPNHLPIHILHAPDVVTMNDKAVQSGREKPNNSMAVGLDLLRNGEAQAFVTAGNTGAAMFNALKKLGRIKGVLRPALAGILPVKTGYAVLIDLGANVDCRPDFLFQFAVMGSIYAGKMLHIEKPRIGLLSNGEEAGKGSQLVKDTFPLLEASGLNFIGNIEGKELFGGQADVAVTDGFTGNILLKSSEAVAKLLTDILKEELTSSLRTKLGGLLAMPAFQYIKQKMDPSEFGAAPLLGIDGLVFVGHGRSDANAMYNAIKVARDAAEMDLLTAISGAIQSRLS